ncbi:MAG TPA: helix-turn-helix transcriptional regulator [bacterium]|nr:helix-turn-helix transcriptional regulator [bacterium]
MATLRQRSHAADPDVAAIAALIGDPVRAAMLLALLDGAALPATELACRGGASPQAASAHLRKLVDGRLLTVSAAGRQRRYRLAGREVAHAIEALLSVAPPRSVVALTQSLAMDRLRAARTCYDHLAGRLGVAVTDALVTRGAIHPANGEFEMTGRGRGLFRGLGIDVDALRQARRAFARACTDWTERRPHLAGSLGKALLDQFVAHTWLVRSSADRSVRLTPRGERALGRLLGVQPWTQSSTLP